MFKIVNVIICYYNGEEVVKYIDSMKNHELIENVCFVVTVNAARDCDYEIINDYITSGQMNVIIYNPNKNLGYMNGLIQGYRFYREKYSAPEYVVMSNTDIEIPDKYYYKRLLEKEYDNSVACIGPSIFVPEKKTYDNPVATERRTLHEMNRIISRFSIPVIGGLYVYLSTVKGYIFKNKKNDSKFVYEVHGCYFILTKIFAEMLKDKTYGVLMYSEEAYISELIYKANMKTYYDSHIEVIHQEHSTTKFVKCSRIAKYIKESMQYIRDEFY